MDELLYSTDLFVGANPSMSDDELAARVTAMFACPHDGGRHDQELRDTDPEPDCVLAFVREVRQLHFFG